MILFGFCAISGAFKELDGIEMNVYEITKNFVDNLVLIKVKKCLLLTVQKLLGLSKKL